MFCQSKSTELIKLKTMEKPDCQGTNRVCSKCKKTGNLFCTNCEVIICTSCAADHKGNQSLRNHKLEPVVQWQESKQNELLREIQRLTDAKTEINRRNSSSREIIMNLKQVEVQQIRDVNRIREAIKTQVDVHHDQLIEQMHSIYHSFTEQIEQCQQLLQQSNTKVEDEIKSLTEVSLKQDLLQLNNTLKNLHENVTSELTELDGVLIEVNPSLTSDVRVVDGEDWDPEHSTQIQRAGMEVTVRQKRLSVLPVEAAPTGDKASESKKHPSIKVNTNCLIKALIKDEL